MNRSVSSLSAQMREDLQAVETTGEITRTWGLLRCSSLQEKQRYLKKCKQYLLAHTLSFKKEAPCFASSLKENKKRPTMFCVCGEVGTIRKDILS